MINFFVAHVEELDRINDALESRGINAGDVISITPKLDDPTNLLYLVFYCGVEDAESKS